MLEVQKYLRDSLAEQRKEFMEAVFGIKENYLDNRSMSQIALDSLTNEYAIKCSIWEDKLVVLNYSQIDSPKYHQITEECRSLVLDMENFDVVSRSFDRFFNYGEDERVAHVPTTELIAYEKVDGSLISLFFYEGEWLYRTKSMIMPDNIINGNADGVTWKQRIDEGLENCTLYGNLHEGYTYIFELTCRENRVVTKYADNGKLWILTVRNNKTGDYFVNRSSQSVFCKYNGFKQPRQYSFDTWEHCAKAAKELRDLEEGYVLYNQEGVPCFKLKNPAYVAAHHLRGEGVLSEKRILDIILLNESDEYLTIFPEDTNTFQPYMDAYNAFKVKLDWVASFSKANREKLTQKEYAMLIKDSPLASVGFSVRQGKTVEEAINRLTSSTLHSMILAYKTTSTRNHTVVS